MELTLILNWILKPFRFFLCNNIPLRFYNKVQFPHLYGITIHDKARIADGVKILNNVTIGQRNDDDQGHCVIENNVYVGANSCLIGGLTIGKGSMIGAGSVITKDVPPFTIVAGNPAKVIRTIENYSEEYYEFRKKMVGAR
jgi:acetyltransferase-like isoleucine patch superfamily enzyme